MRDDDVPRVAQTSSWSRLCSMVPQGAVRWLIWSLRQGKLMSSLCLVRTPSCFSADLGSKGRRVSDALRPSPNQRTRRLTRRGLNVHEARTTPYVGGRQRVRMDQSVLCTLCVFDAYDDREAVTVLTGVHIRRSLESGHTGGPYLGKPRPRTHTNVRLSGPNVAFHGAETLRSSAG